MTSANSRPMSNEVPEPSVRRLATSTALRRGLTRRCAVCGQGGLFRRWFSMVDDCPRCALHFERLEGHWIGALAVNTMVTFGVMFVALGITMVAAYPDYPIATMLAVLLPIPIVMPLLFFPFSRTLWTAMDLLLRPLEPGEVDDDFFPTN